MIKIESLHIERFRGIKKISIDLKKKNFAICGHNGSGKSGVVDAIDFAFTGNVSRLKGEGCGDLSIKEHAPHVDHRKEPKKCFVKIKYFDISLNKSIEISRALDNPKNFTVTPNDTAALKSAQQVADHPEFVLSRREILQYILTEPGKRSKEVQALLKLDDVEKVRGCLTQALNAAVREEKRAQAAHVSEQVELLQSLGISDVKKELILAAVNERRGALGLSLLTDLGKETSVKEGLSDGKLPEASKINKKASIEAVNALIEIFKNINADVQKALDKTVEIFKELEAQPSLLRDYRKNTFYITGAGLIESDTCPFCDLEWDVVALKKHLQEKIENAKQVKKFKERLQDAAKPLIAELRILLSQVQTASKVSKALSVPNPMVSFELWEKKIIEFGTELLDFEAIDKIKSVLISDWKQAPSGVDSVLNNIQEALFKIPDISKEDQAKEYLILVQERIERFRKARDGHESWRSKLKAAETALSVYLAVSESVLNGVYEAVEKDFAKYYQQINAEDESNFHAKFTPKEGALTFEVDFFKRGLFPPTAYHSEGHQDSMGVCLYLALMKKICGHSFTFAVLDDVLMSVDSGHRKEVCKLLKTEFSSTQFIMTTHDKVWFQQMISEGVITNATGLHFRKWSVESGPVGWEEKGVWEGIDLELDQDRVPTAAGDLRRFLEYISLDLARKSRAKVELCAVEDYDLGQLLPAVTARFGELFKKAIRVAESWEQIEKIDQLKKLQQAYSEKLKQTDVERWTVNKSVHYNEWINFRAKEFKDVMLAFKSFLDALKCSSCQSFLYVVPQKGQTECLKCECGALTFNLIESKNPDKSLGVSSGG